MITDLGRSGFKIVAKRDLKKGHNLDHMTSFTFPFLKSQEVRFILQSISYPVIIVINCVNNYIYEIDLTLTNPQTSPHTFFPFFSVTTPFPSSLLTLLNMG